ncbi:ABC transporter permease [Mesorhizobium sp. CGMCC 1.15528]|uniref:ABC transporter permease n=1 Tax=Mesorhizobium zhangyense TaxID=1776730 RepID=A0A7C9VGL6_9HYPH|nr:ABC transporter permease [Mesorhizobium zhangyense]NGN44532.1 ABC transporter permease [Mesorhizobium zhangyense]
MTLLTGTNDTRAAPPALNNPSVKGRQFSISNDTVVTNILVVALVVMMLVFSSQSSAFFTLSNFEVIVTNYAAVGVVAAAMTLLVISGNVDLSVGSNIGLSGMVTALSITNFGLSAGMAVAAGIATGAGIGVINGLLCGVLGFNAIIVTLGMLALLRGVTLLFNSTEVYGLGETFFWIGNGDLLGIPVLLWAVVLAFGAVALVTSTTIWGRYIYAVGINRQAAFLAALPVRSLLLSLHIATGAAAGLAGILLAGRLDGASPGSLGLQLEMQVLTIVLLGGVAFAGGRGRVFGVITAWLFLGVLDNGLTLLNVPPFVQLVASGLALVFAASLDAFGNLLRSRTSHRRLVKEQRRNANEHN